MICPDCDRYWDEEGWEFCPICGAKLMTVEDMEERRRELDAPGVPLEYHHKYLRRKE